MNRLGAVRLLGGDGDKPREGRLFAELGRAIDTTGLSVHFQPEVDMRTGHVSVVEALVRWRHPRRGFLPPAAFVPVAEGSPLMRPLTLRVLAEALRRLRQWDLDAAGAAQVAVAVNVSASTLTDSLFARRVLLALDQSSIAPSRLELEITEHELPVDPAAVRAGLAPLVDAGVIVSIDDFGTGYSSLSRLTSLPLSKVKIDRTFVGGLGTDRNADIIVASTIDLAGRLGMQVVAEGVETELQYRRLLELGCDFAQGFYVCPPVHALRFVRWTGLRDDLPRPIPVVTPAPTAPPRRARRAGLVASVAVAASAATLTAAAAFPGGAGDVIGALRGALGADRTGLAAAPAPKVVPVPVPVAGAETAPVAFDAVLDAEAAAEASAPADDVAAAPVDLDERATDVLAEIIQKARAVTEAARQRRSTPEQPHPEEQPAPSPSPSSSDAEPTEPPAEEPPPSELPPPAEETPPTEEQPQPQG